MLNVFPLPHVIDQRSEPRPVLEKEVLHMWRCTLLRPSYQILRRVHVVRGILETLRHNNGPHVQINHPLWFFTCFGRIRVSLTAPLRQGSRIQRWIGALIQRRVFSTTSPQNEGLVQRGSHLFGRRLADIAHRGPISRVRARPVGSKAVVLQQGALHR